MKKLLSNIWTWRGLALLFLLLALLFGKCASERKGECDARFEAKERELDSLQVMLDSITISQIDSLVYYQNQNQTLKDEYERISRIHKQSMDRYKNYLGDPNASALGYGSSWSSIIEQHPIPND